MKYVIWNNFSSSHKFTFYKKIILFYKIKNNLKKVSFHKLSWMWTFFFEKLVLKYSNNATKVIVKGLKDKEEEKCERKEIKKEKAWKINEEIMNYFKSIISNLKAQDEMQQDELLTSTQSAEREICSICLTTKESYIWCYPIRIYMTKIPFIVGL